MRTLWIVCALALALAGCTKKEQAAGNAVPMKDQPRPSSTPQQIIEDMTGKTDVKAGQRAMATIQRVQRQETGDYDEVTK